jgi:hypothetical protein
MTRSRINKFYWCRLYARAERPPRLQKLLGAGSNRRCAQEAKTVLDHANANTLNEWDGPEIAIATQLRSDLN